MRLALIALLAAGCASADPPAGTAGPPPVSAADPSADTLFADLADYERQRVEALAALNAVVGEPVAGAAAACRAFPVGARPCGGPERFVVVSTEVAQVPLVLDAARRVETLDRRANAQFERISTCEVRVPPTVVLREGRCVAVR